MQEISVKEKKDISLRILEEVHNFCVKNNIKYFLGYGTLLGAIRHKGFIPWDDDIDICMLRDDYEIFKKKFYKEDLSLISNLNESCYPLTFTKISNEKTFGLLYNEIHLNYGVAIDVFPIDDYPNNEVLRKQFFKKQDNLSVLYRIALSCNYIRHKDFYTDITKKILSKFISARRLSRKIDKYANRFNSKEAAFAGCVVEIPNHKMEISKKSNYDSQILLPFENKCFFAPIGWDDILKSIYGDDYMIPPDIKDRKSAHTETYYWKE